MARFNFQNMSVLSSTILLLFAILLNDMVKGKHHLLHHKKPSTKKPKAFSDVTVTGRCAEINLGDISQLAEAPVIPETSWMQTPSVVELPNGHFSFLSRTVHLEYVKEQMVIRNANFEQRRQNTDFVEQVVIQADTVFIQSEVSLIGVRHFSLYARELIAAPGSRLNLSSPDWEQVFLGSQPAGANGKPGKGGIDGPLVEVFVGYIRGSLEIITSGGNGHKGQDGAKGGPGANNEESGDDATTTDCRSKRSNACTDAEGHKGPEGGKGKTGGAAGMAGRGGNAGHTRFIYLEILGAVSLSSCSGTGAESANYGGGGDGGAGGRGGRARNCYVERSRGGSWCEAGNLLDERGEDGDTGETGDHGQAGAPGQDGEVTLSSIRPGILDDASKEAFSLDLLTIIKRQAEDVLLGDSSDVNGIHALNFLMFITSGRSDAVEIIKEVKRKLGFLAKPGYDIFGKSEMFAPRIKWQALKKIAEDIKEAATEYEKAYNSLQDRIVAGENFQRVAQEMATVSEVQVKAEKDRLVEAKLIAESEKRLYVRSIQQLEAQMETILSDVNNELSDVVDAATFNRDDTLAVMQGLVGFVSSLQEPLDFIGHALTLARDTASKSCVKTLSQYEADITKWLTFGRYYSPLVDSSDLNFDLLDVASVPEVMMVNLEMNKEALTRDLVCLIEINSRPQDKAELERLMESFFIAGAARIDLIAKVMDLDNEIGGYNFDIPLLEQTQQAISELGNPTGAPISQDLQLNFLDDLLSTYRTLESSFMMEIYELYKGIKFRSLWEGENPLDTFRRIASESARGTGQLNGVIQLTDVLRNVASIESRAVKCFTNNIFTTGIHKWSFNNQNDIRMFDDIANGRNTRFSIRIDDSSTSCYNVRLLKIFVELYGANPQPSNVPSTIHLQIRHLPASYFRAGGNCIKEYRQPVGSFRKITFDRFAISDDAECDRAKMNGNKQSSFCVTEDDYRWHSMCKNPLSDGTGFDSFLGEEECKSPFGTYELVIPVDQQLSCDNAGIQNKNCKDLDLTMFTKMNVWAHFLYWSDYYPAGPDDTLCRSPRTWQTVLIEAQTTETATSECPTQ